MSQDITFTDVFTVGSGNANKPPTKLHRIQMTCSLCKLPANLFLIGESSVSMCVQKKVVREFPTICGDCASKSSEIVAKYKESTWNYNGPNYELVDGVLEGL